MYVYCYESTAFIHIFTFIVRGSTLDILNWRSALDVTFWCLKFIAVRGDMYNTLTASGRCKIINIFLAMCLITDYGLSIFSWTTIILEMACVISRSFETYVIILIGPKSVVYTCSSSLKQF